MPGQKVLGEPCTTLVPGYDLRRRSTFCVCGGRARRRVRFPDVRHGQLRQAVEQKIYSENISKVLYPNDGTPQEPQLRLRQQYFFVACSLHDIIRRFRLRNNDWNLFPDKVSIQLNDTHPVIAIPELMRILLDEVGLGWEQAWRITQAPSPTPATRCCPRRWKHGRSASSSTCCRATWRSSTKSTSASWRRCACQATMPRGAHVAHRRKQWPPDSYGQPGQRRQLAINGVAELHSQLLRDLTLRDFAEMYPDRFQNKTNGVSRGAS